MSYRYIDVHCHPQVGQYADDQASVIAHMKEEGVAGIVVGVDEETSRQAVLLADQHPHLWASVGLHPNDAPLETFVPEVYETLAANPKVVAVGECGLDYYRIPKERDVAEEKERQWTAFTAQTQFALDHHLPLMIHSRPTPGSMDAYEDMLSFLEPFQQEHSELSGNVHFFVGNLAIAQRFWRMGFTTSFTGVITFAKEYDEVVREASLSMIMTETDSPYVSPVPHRGKRNEPSYVSYVASHIALLRGEDEELVRKTLLKNAERVFKIEGLV